MSRLTAALLVTLLWMVAIALAAYSMVGCCPKPKHCYEQQSRYSHQELLNEAAAELAHGQVKCIK